MDKRFIDQADTQLRGILATVEEAFAKDTDAAFPVSSLPVLARAAKCRPDGDGNFVFRAPSPCASRCGWSERVLAMLALLACAPFLALVSLLVLAFDGRPVLFRQERFGRDGKPFFLLKFRTMKRQSEILHEQLQCRLGQEGWLFKLERDPRVTRLGAVLRCMFIDELPQLVNVARGEMRFVGPRPLPASDQGHYTCACHALRLKGLPGMTGLWQVSGRNRLTFDEMCLLDIYYLCNRSLRFDLWLVARTVGVVFKQISLTRESERRGEESRLENAGDCGNHADGEPYPLRKRGDERE